MGAAARGACGREKYIDLPAAELYDLADDAREERNIAAMRSERTTVLMGVLRGFNLAPPNRPEEETGGVRERLRALGYLGGSPAVVRERYTENDDPKRLIELDRMLHRGRELFEANRPAEAVAVFREIIARRPDMADAYRQMASLLWQMGQPGPRHRDARSRPSQRPDAEGYPGQARDVPRGSRGRTEGDSPACFAAAARHRNAELAGHRLRAGQPASRRDARVPPRHRD